MGVVAGLLGNPLLAVEGEEIRAERIKRGEERREHSAVVEPSVDPAGLSRLVADRGQDFVLAPKAGKGHDAGQREAAEEERPARPGHQPLQPAELAHVDHAAHGVHHAARAQEQQGLEERMGEEVEHAGGHAELAARAESKEHVAELADRGIGQDPLQVGLRQGDERGQKRGEAADARHDFLRVGRGGIKRRAAGHHIDSRGDHRRGVDQRADGRGAFHRVGQPDMQRELGALAAGPDQEQEANGGNHATFLIGSFVRRHCPKMPCSTLPPSESFATSAGST